MSTETDLVAWLKAQPALTALISERIYPVQLPDEVVLPAVTYKRISTVPDVDLEDVGIRQARFEFSCWAKSYLATLDVAAPLRAALEFTSPPGPSIDRILPDGSADHHEEGSDLSRRTLDFLIFER